MYGIIPLDSMGRTIAIVLTLFIMTTCQLMIKVFALALCSIVSSTIFVLYLVVDYTIFYAWKVARNDFWLKWPIYNVPVRIIVSFLFHFLAKIFFDFTGVTNCRQPAFLGGAYSMFVTFSTPFVCLLFGWMYLEHVKDEAVSATFEYVFPPKAVYGAIGGLGALQILTFLLFLGLIEPKYRPAFTSFTTMPQQTQEEFRTFTEPDLKVGIFDRHTSMWEPIAEEVRTWLNEPKNLPTRIREKPSWFTDRVKSHILDEFVKDPRMLNEIRGIKVQALMSRRKSLGGGVSTRKIATGNGGEVKE